MCIRCGAPRGARACAKGDKHIYRQGGKAERGEGKVIPVRL